MSVCVDCKKPLSDFIASYWIDKDTARCEPCHIKLKGKSVRQQILEAEAQFEQESWEADQRYRSSLRGYTPRNRNTDPVSTWELMDR